MCTTASCAPPALTARPHRRAAVGRSSPPSSGRRRRVAAAQHLARALQAFIGARRRREAVRCSSRLPPRPRCRRRRRRRCRCGGTYAGASHKPHGVRARPLRDRVAFVAAQRTSPAPSPAGLSRFSFRAPHPARSPALTPGLATFALGDTPITAAAVARRAKLSSTDYRAQMSNCRRARSPPSAPSTRMACFPRPARRPFSS